MGLRSLSQIITRPAWALSTAIYGKPEFETLKPYLKSQSQNSQQNPSELSDFIRKKLKDVVDIHLLESIRALWPHKLIVKGVLNEQDAELAKQAGADAIIVSNHGGRQLDAALPTITQLPRIRERLGEDFAVMADSGVESGVDLARFLAQGADMVFSGRAFMYGVGALGEAGAGHVFDILQTELLQVLEQLRCSHPTLLKNHRVE
jgi:L-lactate dehydrogenase (cytochrome)